MKLTNNRQHYLHHSLFYHRKINMKLISARVYHLMYNNAQIDFHTWILTLFLYLCLLLALFVECVAQAVFK